MRIEYVAGLFDGEGSIGLYRFHGGKYYLRTQLTQNRSFASTCVLQELVRCFGGSLSKQRSSSGRIKYNWQVGGIKAASFLEEILPYLILKRPQALLAVRWQNTRPKPSRNKSGQFNSYKNKQKDFNTARELKRLKESENGF